MTETKTAPRIYVACLASYNAGTLHGEWIDATQDADEIQEEIDAMIEASPTAGAEEWAIQDAEGLGKVVGGVVNACDLEKVSALAQGVEEHGQSFLAFHESGALDGIEPHEWEDRYLDAYRGCYSSLADYVEELFQDLGGTPSGILGNYIDWESLGRDMELGGDVWTARTPGFDLYVFDGWV